MRKKSLELKMISKSTKIFIAGHKGMVGSALVRALEKEGYENIIVRDRLELDLTNQQETKNFIRNEKIDVIIDTAAKVGGILANDTYPYDFIMQNMQIQNNLIDAAVENNISKFIFLGSSCIYPKFAPQPMKEEYLLTGPLEPTNQWYAIAKISGIMACKAARIQKGLNAVSLMPTNLYGFNDNFDLNGSHVLPAMIRKFHEAKLNNKAVTLWGTGSPFREFLHVDDLAQATLFALKNNLEEDLYNVGFGSDVTIKELANLVQSIVEHTGEIIWDKTKPDGTPKKLMDSKKLRSLGWEPKINLEEGIRMTYEWFLNSLKSENTPKGIQH
jgi:GDP-L-fucose synthase